MPTVMTGRRRFWGILIVVFWLSSCGPSGGPSPSLPAPTYTPSPPTATPEPLAALINGEPILLADFESELARYQSAFGIDLASTSTDKEQILQVLVDQRLLAQAATTNGAKVSEASLDQKIGRIAEELGGLSQLETWLDENFYSAQRFRDALAEEMLAQQMVERITSEVSVNAVHVRARHIVVSNRSEAEQLHQRILAGEDFGELAAEYSTDVSTRPAGGDLGWFPAGHLLSMEVETAAFALEPGQMSEIVESDFGYHLIQTLEREDRLLAPDALMRLQEQSVTNWLRAQREAADIQIIITL